MADVRRRHKEMYRYQYQYILYSIQDFKKLGFFEIKKKRFRDFLKFYKVS